MCPLARIVLTPSRPGGALFALLTTITADLQNGLQFGVYCFVTFLSMSFPFRKVQFHQPAVMQVAMATMQLSGLILKTGISIVFQVFPPERNFLLDNLLCFGHHNTLISLIIANIRSLNGNIPEIILPKYGHRH